MRENIISRRIRVPGRDPRPHDSREIYVFLPNRVAKLATANDTSTWSASPNACPRGAIACSEDRSNVPVRTVRNYWQLIFDKIARRISASRPLSFILPMAGGPEGTEMHGYMKHGQMTGVPHGPSGAASVATGHPLAGLVSKFLNDLASQGKTPATLSSYRSDLTQFHRFTAGQLGSGDPAAGMITADLLGAFGAATRT